MFEKEKCIESISISLKDSSRWQLNNAEKYPADKRSARSAKLLAKLASETAHLSDESWQALQPHFQTAQWNEALRQTSRLVGFSFRKMSLTFFVRNLSSLLSEPATAA